MVLKKQWKVVGGTVAAAMALGTGAAVAQSATGRPETIDLDDVVMIDQVTPSDHRLPLRGSSHHHA